MDLTVTENKNFFSINKKHVVKAECTNTTKRHNKGDLILRVGLNIFNSGLYDIQEIYSTDYIKVADCNFKVLDRFKSKKYLFLVVKLISN